MARFIEKALAGLGTGVAAVGQEYLRDEILAKRDARLNEYAQKSTAATQQYSTEERLASQEFTSSENEKNRQSSERIATTRALGDGAGGYKVTSKGLANVSTGELIPFPTSESEMMNWAVEIGTANYKAAVENAVDPSKEDPMKYVKDQYEQIKKMVNIKKPKPSALSDDDQAAIDWAKKNPNDPRAQKILKLNGM